MPRPDIPEIHVPNAKSPLSRLNENVSKNVCGGSWDYTFDLVRPFKDLNNHQKNLIKLGTQEDLNKIPNLDFLARIEDAIESTWNDLDQFNDQEIISTKDYENIRLYLNRASKYAMAANKLWDFWDDEYVPENLEWTDLPDREVGPVEHSPDAHWPLGDYFPFLGSCGNAFGENSQMQSLSGKEIKTKFKEPFSPGESFWVKFTCPNKKIIKSHNEDYEIYKNLMHAAAINARCAQECVYSLAFYELNKKEFEKSGRHFGDVDSVSAEEAPKLPTREPTKSSNKFGTMLALSAAALVLLKESKKR